MWKSDNIWRQENKERILAYISTMETSSGAVAIEAQPDYDRIAVQLLRLLQQNAANKRATKLMQRRMTQFFCVIVMYSIICCMNDVIKSWIILIITLIIRTLDYPNVFTWSRLVRIIEVALYTHTVDVHSRMSPQFTVYLTTHSILAIIDTHWRMGP